MRRALLPAAGVALVGSVWWMELQASDFHDIDTGYERFCLPTHLSILDHTPSVFTRLIKEGDVEPSNGEFMVSFEPEQIARSIPSYITEEAGMPALMHVDITYLGEERAQDSLRGGPFSEGLRLEEDYTHVQKIPGRNAYRVSQLPFPDILLWDVYSLKPEADRPIPASRENYHLGACIFYTAGNSKCTVDTSVEGYRVSLQTNEPNIFLKDELKGFLADQFASWRANCGK